MKEWKNNDSLHHKKTYRGNHCVGRDFLMLVSQMKISGEGKLFEGGWGRLRQYKKYHELGTKGHFNHY